MARPDAEQKLVPSVLDRMIDDRPRDSSEATDTLPRSIAQVRASVKRDLEWLLNSRQIVAKLPVDLRQLDRSLLTYGLPDFTAAGLSSIGEQDLLRRTVEDAVLCFEPRLSRVTVAIETVRELERAIRFRIDAMLNVDPEPEPVSFDSVLQLTTKTFVVSDQ